MKELAERVVKCKAWRWMPGMRWRVTADMWRIGRNPLGRVDDNGVFPKTSIVPDLSDPATLGCLEALVIKAWKGEAYLCRGGNYWQVFIHPIDLDRDGSNPEGYIEALVCALEAA